MPHKTREAHEAARPTTVLDPLRPAVVRRRVVDASLLENGAAPRAFSTERSAPREEDFDEDSGPPSSINVARALASLRADELRRVEELVNADDAHEAERVAADARAAAEASARPAPAAPSSPPPPRVLVGKTIGLPKLADQMGMQAKDLTAQLVASGFYSVHAKTVFPRETARTVAGMFGWHVEDAPDAEEPEAASSKRAAKASSSAKKPKPATKTKKKR